MLNAARELTNKYDSFTPELDVDNVLARMELLNEVWGFSHHEAVLSAEASIIDKHGLMFASVGGDGVDGSCIERPKTGNRLHRVIVEEGEIKLPTADQRLIVVGSVEQFLSIEAYQGGAYTTEVGMEIDVIDFIESMTIDTVRHTNIKQTPRAREHAEDTLTRRGHQFNGMLFNRFRSSIPTTD
jgi:hypothetical protein